MGKSPEQERWDEIIVGLLDDNPELSAAEVGQYVLDELSQHYWPNEDSIPPHEVDLLYHQLEQYAADVWACPR